MKKIQVAVALGLDLKHPQAGVVVVERDPFDQPGQAFGKASWSFRLQVQRLWKVSVCLASAAIWTFFL
jgi:hypothetical protein